MLRFLWCARYVVYLGASPLQAVMTGTASRSKGVRREAESEGSVKQNSDLTNRNRIEGQRSGVTRQWTGRPNSHPGAAGVNPAGAFSMDENVLSLSRPCFRSGSRRRAGVVFAPINCPLSSGAKSTMYFLRIGEELHKE